MKGSRPFFRNNWGWTYYYSYASNMKLEDKVTSMYLFQNWQSVDTMQPMPDYFAEEAKRASKVKWTNSKSPRKSIAKSLFEQEFWICLHADFMNVQ